MAELERREQATRLAGPHGRHPVRADRLDGDERTSIDRLADLAARLLGTPAAQVSVIGAELTVVGAAGTAAGATGSTSPAEDSLCTVTTKSRAALVVEDAAADERVRDLPPVAEGGVGAYLGVPLWSGDLVIGALSVYEDAPRTWTEQDVATLEELTRPVLAELELAALATDYDDERVLWELAVDAAGVGAWDFDVATRRLRFDDRMLDIFGVDADTFGESMRGFDRLIHVDDRHRVGRAVADALESVGEYVAEYRVVRPDGAVRWVRAKGRALPGPDGKAVRFLGAAYDTTVVRDTEARIARTLEAMPSAFFQLDQQWRFTFVNPEARRLLGIRPEMSGEVVWDLFPALVGTGVERRYRHAVATGEPVEFEGRYPEPVDRWFEVRAWPSPDGLSVYLLDISDRRRAREVLAVADRRTEVLTAVTDALTETLDPGEGVRRLANATVPVLGDWAVVVLVGDLTGESDALRGSWRRQVRDVGCWHVEPTLRPLVERYCELRLEALTDESLLVQSLGTGRPIVVPTGAAHMILAGMEDGEAKDLLLTLDPGGLAIVPLRARGHTVGLLSIFREKDAPPFDDDDAAVIEEVAGRAALALDNARLYAGQRKLAETLQRSMMTPPPKSDHLEVVVRYTPAAQAAQVGGDWYDAFRQAEGATVIAIGDVVGHDTEAAAAMSQVRSLLRGIAVHSDDGPADVLRGVDRAMARLDVDTTATAVIARFEQSATDRAAGHAQVRWSNAGHPPPMMVIEPEQERADGESRSWRLGERPGDAVDALWADRFDLLLGLDPETPRTETVVTLRPGATVWLYTDGLVERRGQDVDEGIERMRAVLSELAEAGLDRDLEACCDELLRRMLPERPEDDVALVAVRLRGER